MEKKKKENKYDNIHTNFKEEKEKEKYKELKNTYKKVKKEYIANKNLDITLERIYLEKKIEQYSGETIKLYMTIFITVMSTILTITVERAISEATNILVSIIVLVAIILVFIIWASKKDKNIKREIDEYNYYKICLKVLEDIEKGEGRV